MKLTTLAAGLVLAISAPALAQTAPSSGPPPSAAALAHAKHLMASMHMDTMMDQMTSQMMKPIMDSVTKDATPEVRSKSEAFNAALWDEMKAMMPKLTDAMVTIYAQGLTDQELADLDQFYSSPSGQAVLMKMPKLTGQLVPVMLAQMPSMLTGTFDRYCAKEACTADERTAMAKAVENFSKASKAPATS